MSRGQVISNVTQTFKDNAEYTITPPQGFEAMEKATVIVDVEQPLVQNNKTQTITNPSETITINPDEGYDALKKVTVTTNIPLQNNKTQTITNPNETVTITPDTGYEALKQVTVTTNVPIPELETWTNKRFISTGTINVGNVMNDNTKAGISKESTFVIDVPTPSITQISNYPVTTTGTVNVPIPSGYDAVDSISLSVNVPSKIEINKFYYSYSYSSQLFSAMIKVTSNYSTSISSGQGLIQIYEDNSGYSISLLVNMRSSSISVTIVKGTCYYKGSVETLELYNNNQRVLTIDESSNQDTRSSSVSISKSMCEIIGLPS